MIDFLFHITLNNVGLSLALAIIAAGVGIAFKRPALTHLFWLLVFVKLLLPPLITLPAVPAPDFSETSLFIEAALPGQPDFFNEEKLSYSEVNTTPQAALPEILSHWKHLLFFTWISGSLFVMLWSLFQVSRFHGMLKRETETALPAIQSIAVNIADHLGLKTTPITRITHANISPMVWWIGGKVWLIIPESLIKRLDTEQLKLILGHELAHVSRWDYMCRWIEWFASVVFWWNPVVWWARKNLRANEELCCDEMVLSSMKAKPYIYGDTLLKSLDILTSPTRFQMVMASNFNGGDLLKRRLKLIVSQNESSTKFRWVNGVVLLAALLLLPLGLIQASINDNKKVELELAMIEQKLNKTEEKLSEELSKKEKFRKARQNFDKSISARAIAQRAAESALKSMVESFDPLEKKLDISKDDFQKLKDILYEQMMEISGTLPSNIITATDEEKKERSKKVSEINLKYADIVTDFLGPEKTKIFVDYRLRLSERTRLKYFFEKIPSEKHLSEDQVEHLIDTMNAARKAVYHEMGTGIDLDISSNLTENNISLEAHRTKLIYDAYIKEAAKVMPPDMADLFREDLYQSLKRNEAMMKTQLFEKKKM